VRVLAQIARGEGARPRVLLATGAEHITQAAIVALLRAEGIVTTQATVSRDVSALGVPPRRRRAST